MKLFGIIAAMESEANILIEVLKSGDGYERRELSGTVFHSGVIGCHKAVVAVCGIGKVCAAVCAQIMIDIFGVDFIINTGVAGGLDKRLDIGDFVVASSLIEYDFDLTVFGYAKGYLPCSSSIYKAPDKSRPTEFLPDDRLASALCEAASRTFGKNGTGGKYIKGIITSGDAFVCSDKQRQGLISGFGAAAVEMEGAAVAQTAALSGIPFAVIRAVSDLADGRAAASFDEFEKEAAALSSEILIEMLGKYN